MRHKAYYVYIMTNRTNNVLYTGITSALEKRSFDHKLGVGSRFTSKYRAGKLVYYELFDNPRDAIDREKQIKGGSRAKKIALIERLNPAWKDLSVEL